MTSHVGIDPLRSTLDAAESWVVLATGMLITACYTKNFFPIDLLRAPVAYPGLVQIQGDRHIAHAAVPNWLPLSETILIIDKALLTRIKDFPLPMQSNRRDDGTIHLLMDVTKAELPRDLSTCTLTYFPWFRYLSEPINFDAAGKVAVYVSDVFRFFFARKNHNARVIANGDTRTVSTDFGLQVDVVGMTDLRSVRIATADTESTFDLVNREVKIDGRMFPAAFHAACEILNTDDRLTNMNIVRDGEKVSLRYAEGTSHV